MPLVYLLADVAPEPISAVSTPLGLIAILVAVAVAAIGLRFYRRRR